VIVAKLPTEETTVVIVAMFTGLVELGISVRLMNAPVLTVISSRSAAVLSLPVMVMWFCCIIPF
jgi:hypothetical protein